MAFNAKKEYASLKARTDKYATDISKIYSSAVNELLKLIPTEAGEEFSFDDNPRIAKKASDILRRMQAAAETAIRKDIKLEWALGNKAADEFLSTMFGKKVLNDPRFAGWTKRNGDALNAFMESHAGGMALSDRIWKTAEQLRDEMQLAVSVSIGSGKSASTISREVRQYLKYPDKLFRRVKIGTNPDGTPKYRLSEAAKAFHSGKGVYRSSYKNAMRLARTETNAAYRTADSERWRQMDFVTGIRISLSHSHPMPDICDELAGDYPKDFIFTGWHPQCFCYATPITISQDKFVEMQKAKLAGEQYDTSAEQITEMPDKFTEWCERNKGRIAEAQKNGTLPYFLKDNPDKLKEALSASQLKEALKTEEYRLGKETLARMRQIPDYDTSDMQQALKSGDLKAIKAETEKYAQVKEQLSNLTYIDNGFEEAKKWGMKNILASEQNVAEHIAKWEETGGLQMVKASSDWYAHKYLGGNVIDKATGLPTQKKFPHWEVLQKAYERQIVIAQDKIEWQQLDKTLKDLQMFSGGSGYDALYLKASNAFVLKNKELVKATISEMEEFRSVAEETKALYGKFASKTKSQAVAELDNAIESALEQGNIAEAKKGVSELKEWVMIDDAWSDASKVFDGTDSKLSKTLKAAYSDALESGNMVQAKSALQEAEKWQELIPTFKEAAAFKSKSAEYNKLVAEMQDAIDAGNLAAAKTKQAQIAEKRALLDKKYGKGKKVKVGFQDSYSQERKDAALWDTESKAKKARRQHGKLADDTLFNSASESWKAAIEEEKKAEALIDRYRKREITRAELEALAKQQRLPVYAYDDGFGIEFMTQRQAMYEYTHHYRDVNVPLELRAYDQRQEIERFYAKVNAITDYIDTCATPKDMWFQRGDDDLSAVLGRLEFAGQADDSIRKICGKYISDLKTSDLQGLVGKTMQEGGFMSAGSAKRKGFDEGWGKRVIINIFAPNGSRAMYAEHFSEFGRGAQSWRWDGSHQSTSFSQEFETIFQRGTKMRITKAEIGTYDGSNVVYLDVEIVGQEARNISYVPKSKISR